MALSNQARTAAFALGILAQYGILFACGLPYWSTNNWQVSDALYGRIPAFNGVWWKCMSLKNGGFTCNNYGKPTIFVEDSENASKHGGRGSAIASLGILWGLFYIFFWITFFPDWSHSSWQLEENLMGRVKRFNGIFLRCISPKQGSFKCDNYGKPSLQVGAIFTHIIFIFICAFPDWKHNAWQISDSLLGRLANFAGIWWRCFSPKWGIFLCDNLGSVAIYSKPDIQTCRALMCIATIFSFFAVVISLLALDCATVVEPGTKAKRTVSLVAGIFYIIAAEVQAQRALMVIAVLLSLFGLVIGMVSLRCTTMVDNESKSKSYVGITSGMCFLISGVCCGVAVSWWAWRVTEEYFSPFYASREFKFEYGTCLYLGWVSMLFGTCVMVATIWYGVQVQKDFYNPLKQANSFKYEYGSCLYLGWISAGLTIIAGLILTVGSCKNLREEEQSSYSPYAYNSHPSKSEMLINKTEYV